MEIIVLALSCAFKLLLRGLQLIELIQAPLQEFKWEHTCLKASLKLFEALSLLQAIFKSFLKLQLPLPSVFLNKFWLFQAVRNEQKLLTTRPEEVSVAYTFQRVEGSCLIDLAFDAVQSPWPLA